MDIEIYTYNSRVFLNLNSAYESRQVSRAGDHADFSSLGSAYDIMSALSGAIQMAGDNPLKVVAVLDGNLNMEYTLNEIAVMKELSELPCGIYAYRTDWESAVDALGHGGLYTLMETAAFNVHIMEACAQTAYAAGMEELNICFWDGEKVTMHKK